MMEQGNVSENHMNSVTAFVEGGIQEACDDACSICLEAFCDNNPSTLTGCKHEFHLQCILEWCQRSSQCPMCWQPISLKDPSSQELFDAVEHERNIRMNPPRNTAIFHHPTLGDFELQHLPVSASEFELEDRIIQHLAAMGRARQLARREGQRNRSSQDPPRFLVFSTHHPTGSSPASAASSIDQRGVDAPRPAVVITCPNAPFIAVGEDAQPIVPSPDHPMVMAPGTSLGSRATSSTNRSPAPTSPNSEDQAGPSDLQTFSESLKSRLSTLSMRYKESITKNTRGWKERLFARNSSTPEPTTEVHREGNQGISACRGIGTATPVMDHLEIAEGSRINTSTTSNHPQDRAAPHPTELRLIEPDAPSTAATT